MHATARRGFPDAYGWSEWKLSRVLSAFTLVVTLTAFFFEIAELGRECSRVCFPPKANIDSTKAL